MLMIGVPYLWSMFARSVEQAFLWTRSQTASVFTVSVIGLIIGGIIGGCITGKRSPAYTLRISCIATIAGYSAAVLTDSGLLFYCAYGVVAATGLGMGYNAAMAGFAGCMPGRNGLFNGILLMAYAFCSMLMSPLVSAVLCFLEWRQVFLITGCLAALFLLIASFSVFRPQHDVRDSTEDNGNRKSLAKVRDITPAAMIREKTAQCYLLWGTFAASGGLCMIGQGLQIMEESGSTPTLATACVSTMAFANGLSRFCAGVLWDIFGWKRTMQLATALNIAGNICIAAGVLLRKPIVLFAGAILAAASYGIGTPIGASFVRMFYGNKYFALNYGLINLVGLSASLLGPMLIGALRTALGTYLLPACILLVYAMLTVLVLRAVQKPQ